MDFQNYVGHPKGYWAKRDPEFHDRLVRGGVVANAARAFEAARKRGLRVSHVANRWREGHIDMHAGMPMWAGRQGTDVAIEGCWGAEIMDALCPQHAEPVVVKRSVGALAGTELPRLLTLYRIEALVLAGIATNFVVEVPLGRRLTSATQRSYSQMLPKRTTMPGNSSRSKSSAPWVP